MVNFINDILRSIAKPIKAFGQAERNNYIQRSFRSIVHDGSCYYAYDDYDNDIDNGVTDAGCNIW